MRNISVDGDVNMANSNMRHFLSALGLSTDFENDPAVPIAEFRRALELWTVCNCAELLDTGTPTTESKGAGGATLVFCGVRPGYLSEKVAAALQLTIEAQSKGATEVYFA